MQTWTEIKCYACSRVCAEIARAPGMQIELDGAWDGAGCTLDRKALRCRRCRGQVYLGETYRHYVLLPEAANREADHSPAIAAG